MESRFEKKFKRLEEIRANQIGKIEEWSESQKQFHPEPGAWSALGVIHHLILVEKGVLTLVQKELAKPDRIWVKAGLRSFLGFWMLNIGLSFPIRVKAPVKEILPKEELSFEPLKQEWEEVRKEWKVALDSFPIERTAYLIFKHPIAGHLTFAQTLGFLYRHQCHHNQQLRRIQNAAPFPKKV